ncbi:MAG TPA: class I SAM-dependent methyltransferase [Chloroflexi bacterium]|nr:class I SAM-dependent methyltransferase [Chloroflexota bacterium]
MRIEKGSPLYQQLSELLAKRPGLKPTNTRYIHRYLEMKQIDWNLWHDFSGIALDVGCHIPLDALILSKMKGIRRIYLVDLRPIPSTLLPDKTTFVQCDATRLAFPDNSFDVVTSFSAIEHLPDRALQRAWVREMVRVTKPGGKMLITVDNAWSWLNRIWDRYRPPMRRLSPIELKRWVMETKEMEIEATTGGAIYYWGFRPRFRGSAQIAYLFDRVLNPLSRLLPWFGNRIGYRFIKKVV